MKSKNVKYLDALIIMTHLGFIQYFLMPDEFFVIENIWVDYIIPAGIVFCVSLYFYFFYRLIAKNKAIRYRLCWILFFLLFFIMASFFYYFSIYKKSINITGDDDSGLSEKG